MPCDLLADPTRWQVREIWGTGWDMCGPWLLVLVVGTWSCERSPLSCVWVMSQSREICVIDVLFLSVSKMFFLPSLLLVPTGGFCFSVPHVSCPSIYPCSLPGCCFLVVVFELCVWPSYKQLISFQKSEYAYPPDPTHAYLWWYKHSPVIIPSCCISPRSLSGISPPLTMTRPAGSVSSVSSSSLSPPRV